MSMKKLLSLFSALTLLLNTFLFIFAPLAVAQEPAKYINFEQPTSGIYGASTSILDIVLRAKYDPDGIGWIKFRFAPPGETCQQQYTAPYFNDLGNGVNTPDTDIYTGSWDVSGLADGSYTLCALMHSSAGSEGYIDANHAEVGITIDRTYPVAPEIIFPAPEQYFNSTPILNDWNEAADSAGIRDYRIEYHYDDGHTFSGYPYRTTTESFRNHTPALSEQGGVQFRVQAFDNAGNEGAWGEWRHYYYDATAPVVEITSPIATLLSGTAPIYGSVTDENPHHYWLVVQNLSGSTVAGPDMVNNSASFTNQLLFDWDTTLVPDGAYTIKLEARDAADNKDSNSVQWMSVTVDNAPPTVPVIILPLNSAVLKTENLPKIDWNDSTDASGLILYQYQAFSDEGYTVNKHGPTDWFAESEILTAGTPEGIYYVRVRAKDALGNISQWSNGAGNPYRITIDNTTPLSVFSSPSSSSFWNTAIPVEGESTDNVGVASVDLSYQQVLEGETWHFIDTLSNKFDGSPFSWSFLWTPSSQDVFNLKATATDLAGNMETTASVGNVTYDVTGSDPPILLVPLGGAFTTDFSPTLMWEEPADNVAGIKDYKVQVDNNLDFSSPEKNYSTPNTFYSPNLSEGVWYWKVEARDNALNWSEWSEIRQFTIDITSPAIEWTSPLDGDIVNGTVPLSVITSDDGSGVNRVEFAYSPAGEENWTAIGDFWDTTILPLGNYDLRAIVYDNAGNSAEEIIRVGVASVLFGVEGMGIDTDEARVTWNTDRPTSSRVVYQAYPHPTLGSAPNYGYANSTATFDTGGVTNHTVYISGLSAGTKYAFRVISEGSPVAVSDGYAFETLSNAGAPMSVYTPLQTPLVLGASTTSSVLAYSSASRSEASDETVESESEEDVLGEEVEAAPSPTPAPSGDEAQGLFGGINLRNIAIFLGILFLFLLFLFWLLGRRKK